MFQQLLLLCLLLISVSIMASIYRLIRGKSMPDRVIALDTIGINLIAAIAIYSILLHTSAFFEVILLIGILSFVGTIALARFIERGVAIERKHSK
ncbi:Na(+)/H(+) antiporter subunit F1 [Anaerobacillus isosaccharinicus]|uniref:Na(+)/H(+) antiporter subunit F n=1 Tax=Anaerobacillus isosaccharinicus TaxID=1532552 RepID=A0A1S2KYD1_9BACI|nr:Na(+)/H(+) antiporter subunit F1 [Anaerobacillus isosaccharinicus]MBA5584822.1 Na(+)/H(+) antiporter subunit F1 [Anaerobacillus isosaccharinicus]QOY36815.1 Na(+)/H(+) antiporter subunit F1 [Anaerobacillus isosaccharinicus]